MNTCRLCHKEANLRKSHIVPEFLYEDLYNEKGQMVGVNGIGSKGRRLIQCGIYEPLLCEVCEQYINEHFEKPFRAQWFESSPLPVTWKPEDVHWGQFDYASFKLFHLSVMFRASVSSLGTYQAVSLGPHEERIRQLLLARNTGPAWQYPIFGYAVVHDKTWSVVRVISAPEVLSHAGHRCYGMLYGGAYWCISVSSHRNSLAEQAGLQADGRMAFHAVPWNEVGIIQDAKRFLRGSES